MKKFVHWFNKKKKIVFSDGIDSDAVPEPPRNIPRYFPKKCNFYKADDSCSANHKTVNNLCNSNGTEITNDTPNANGPVCNSSAVTSQVVANECVDGIRKTLFDNLVEDVPILPVITTTGPNNESQAVSASDSLSVNSVENLSRVSSSNNMAMQEADSTHDLPSDWLAKKITSEKKNGGNTFVITITNSTHFHIGTQKTINYPGAENNNNQKGQLQLTNISNGKLLALNGNQMFDIKDRLSEDDLLQISLSVRDNWPELARNLGMEEPAIRELKDSYDNDYNVIVYDVIQQYLNRYPETTVGFMVNVLKKSNELEAIRKLTDKR